MRNRLRTLLIALATGVTLAAAAGATPGANLSFSNRSFRIVFQPIEFIVPGLGTVTCHATWEGAFHSTSIAKVLGNLIGYVTRAFIHRPLPLCGGGFAWILNGSEEIEVLRVIPATTLPWHIRYRSFSGTLPNITAITVDIVDLAFMTRIFETLCLYKSTAASPARVIFTVNAEGQVTVGKIDETVAIPRFSGAMACPATATIRAQGGVRLLGSTTTLIFVSLI